MIFTDSCGKLGKIAISRPDKANALTLAMLDELFAAFDAMAGPDGPKAIILTGLGKVFSSGADLDDAREGLALSPAWERLSGRIASMPCLTVAALNCTVAGGAMGMVLACDMRISVSDARFFYPVMRLGYLPQPSDPVRLAALVGPSRAKLILMAGQKITASEALAWGLVDRLAEPDSLLTEAQALCADVLEAEAPHSAAIKAMIPEVVPAVIPAGTQI